MFDLPGYIKARLERAEIARRRGPGPLHLCGTGAFLQLPPYHPSRRAGLRTPRQCDCTHEIRQLDRPAVWRYPNNADGDVLEPWRHDRPRRTAGVCQGDLGTSRERVLRCPWRCRRVPRRMRRRLHRNHLVECRADDRQSPARPSRSSRSTARRSACSTAWSTTSPPRRKSRNVAIASREGAANYRVRGYLAAQVIRGRTHISWVWDVYDDVKVRALRIRGEEAGGRAGGDPWSIADEADAAQDRPHQHGPARGLPAQSGRPGRAGCRDRGRLRARAAKTATPAPLCRRRPAPPNGSPCRPSR